MWGRVRTFAKAPDVRFAFQIVLASRLIFGAVGAAVLLLQPIAAPLSTADDHNSLILGPGSRLYLLVSPWQRFDALHYEQIARHGYSAVDSAWFPAFPALMRLGGALHLQFALAGLLVSSIAYFAALVLLQRLLVADGFSLTVSRRSAITLAVFPTAMFMVAPYAESLALALTLGTFLAARHERIWLASFLASLATLTRPLGMLAAIPVVWWLWGHRRLSWRLLAAVSPVVTFAVWAWVTYLWTGVAGVTGYNAGKQVIVAPWTAVWRSIPLILNGSHPEGTLNLIAVGLLLLTMVVCWRRMPRDYFWYCAASAVPIACRLLPSQGIASASRYVLMVFPVLVALAMTRISRNAALLLGALALAVFYQYVRFSFIA